MGEIAIPDPGRAQLPGLVGFDLMSAVLSGRKATTLRAYRGDFDDFGRFLGLDAGKSLDVLVGGTHGAANGLALAYRTWLQERQVGTEAKPRLMSPATIARRLAALRSAVTIARRLGRISWELDVESPKIEAYRDTRGPGEDGWKQLREFARDAASDGSAKGVRDVAIIRLLHDLGLRRGEVASLNIADVSLADSSLMILGKGRSEKAHVTMPPFVRAAVAAWLKFRAGAGPDDAVFVRADRAAGETPGRMTGDGLAFVVKDLGRRAKLPKPLRPHMLRHSGITAVLDRSKGDVRSAAKFSRHRDLSSGFSLFPRAA
jgi:integrase/recombinase XerC